MIDKSVVGHQYGVKLKRLAKISLAKRKSYVNLFNSKVYSENEFTFHSEEYYSWVGVFVDLQEYKKAETIYTAYFSHRYCHLLLDCCRALKMPLMFTFIPCKGSIDNVIFLGEKTTKVKSKDSVIKRSAYLQNLVKTIEENGYNIFCVNSVHALFAFDDINVVSIVRDVLVAFLIKSSMLGASDRLEVYKRNTEEVLKLKKSINENKKVLSSKVVSRNIEELSVGVEQEKLLTREEAKNFLNISLPTLSTWTTKGRIKAHGIEGRVYYKKTELIKSLTELK